MQIQDQPHIGVLGADPAAITQFLRRVQALGGEHAVLLPLSPAAVPDCEPYLCGASTQPPLPKLRAAAEVLAASGCTVIAVPDSAGVFCEEITAAVGIPTLGVSGPALQQLVGKLRQRALSRLLRTHALENNRKLLARHTVVRSKASVRTSQHQPRACHRADSVIRPVPRRDILKRTFRAGKLPPLLRLHHPVQNFCQLRARNRRVRSDASVRKALQIRPVKRLARKARPCQKRRQQRRQRKFPKKFHVLPSFAAEFFRV